MAFMYIYCRHKSSECYLLNTPCILSNIFLFTFFTYNLAATLPKKPISSGWQVEGGSDEFPVVDYYVLSILFQNSVYPPSWNMYNYSGTESFLISLSDNSR